MSDNRVGKRIQQYREKAKISQEKLAEMVGLSVTGMSNIERGLNYPSLENFIKITNAIGVSSDLLLCDLVDGSAVAKASELSVKLSKASSAKRNQIFAVIEAMLSTDN